MPSNPWQAAEDAAVSAILLAFPGAEAIPPVGITPWPPRGYELVENPGGYRTARERASGGSGFGLPIAPTPSTCGKCGGGLGGDAIDVCLEYCAAGKRKRLRRFPAGTVCRSCADARALEHGLPCPDKVPAGETLSCGRLPLPRVQVQVQTLW